jgi:hypothetical protein
MTFGRSPVRSVLDWAAVALLLSIGVPARLAAQSQSPLLSGFNPLGDSRSGFQLYDVTGFAGWESVVNPQAGFYLPNGTGLQGDEMVGGGASVGWSRRDEKNSLSLTYTASYAGYVQYSSLSALNQFLTLSLNRRLSPKWSLGLAGSSGISTYDQMQFSPTQFASVVGAPATFADLTSAVLAGNYNNSQLASILTGAPVIESPARTLFFGNRVFVSSVSASLSYAHSRRLSLSFVATGSLSQHMNDGNQQSAPQYLYLIPRAIESRATVGISYSLTPRTQLGVNVSTNRGFSQIQDGYATNGAVTLGRTLGRRWFAQVHGGGGFVTTLRSQYARNPGTTPVFGGSLGYKTFAHSLLTQFDRTLSQSYGLGASQTTTMNAAWQWWRPGRSWGLSSNYVRTEFRGGGFGDANGWRAAFGIDRQIGSHIVIEAGYNYASYANNSTLSPYNSAQHAVRLTMMWMPQGRERR